jgi:hypothetical protein
MLELLVGLGVLLVAPSRVAARQEKPAAQESLVTLEVRVGSAERGFALIDRGSIYHLAKGDVITFLPRGGTPQRGTVAELEERAARVELADPAFVPAPGTRGRLEIPRSRLGADEKPRLRAAPKRAPPAEGKPPPVFTPRDDEWQQGEPLLAKVRAVRPDERPTRLTGHTYFALDHTHASEDDDPQATDDGRHDTFVRLGTSLELENPFGHGDRLHADAEWNYRNVDVPDRDGEEDVELRLERFSYTSGGTRFDPTSLELGRFLQSGMVEFGVLDGAEWIARRRNGHRFGASVGFLPELDRDFQTGEDFQLATFYEWVADESEQFTFAAGYQKTFHDGAADRDLFVASVRRTPREGWAFFGTAWLDLYTAGDDLKDAPVGLTQGELSLGRRWDGGSSLDLVFRHLEFPELERNEFTPVADAQIADDHNERLALTSRAQVTRDTRVLTTLGVWTDEDDDGGDAELGFDVRDLFGERSFFDVSALGTKGSFTNTLGTRMSVGSFLADGRWALDYEFTQNRIDGFGADNDDLPQHRLRLSRDYAWNAWDLSWRIEGLAYDDEYAVQLGLYLQRSHY